MSLDDIKQSRSDISEYLTHWTKSVRRGLYPPKDGISAKDVLINILNEESLLGSNGWIKGGYKCVCFTEAPIENSLEFFNEVESSRYEPYGILVKKVYLFELGARPVIYSSDNEYEFLPDELKWRHVRYEPDDIDFSWEREWRYHADSYSLNPEENAVIVPDDQTRKELEELFKDRWRIFSLNI